MSQLMKHGDELMTLAVAAEEHLREQGHAVKATPNPEVTAFDICPDSGGPMMCRVQAVGRETFEIVRQRGDTFTGVGGEEVMFKLLDRVVTDVERKAA